MGCPLDESPFAEAVRRELQKARGEYVTLDENKQPVQPKGHAPLNSAHEAYSVILEEVCEFWDWVCRKREERDPNEMLKELVQIGAMAQRAAEDLGLCPRS